MSARSSYSSKATWLAASVWFACLPGSVIAAPIRNAEVIQFGPGVSHVKLDGVAYTFVSAWRDNGNAHGYNVVHVYEDPVPGDPKARMAAVPLSRGHAQWAPSSGEELSLITSGGADCTLDTFRLFHIKGVKGTRLVIANRDFGQSFADTAPVHFDFYRLVDHSQDGAGAPRSFDFDHREEASKSYCDVDEALDKELGLPAVDAARLPWAGE